MRKLAKKYHHIWGLLAMIPIAVIAQLICVSVGFTETVTIAIQLPLLALQLFSFYMMRLYRNKVLHD